MNENKRKIVQVVAVVVILIGAFWIWSAVKADKTEDMTEQKLTFDSTLLEGTWVNVDNADLKRTFNADGSFSDTYKGEDDVETTVTGTWKTFDKDNKPANFTYPVGDGAIYMTLNDREISTNFTVSEVTDDTLTLVYLDNGSVMKFTRD